MKTSFKANSKALAEKEGEGIAKMIYRCAVASPLLEPLPPMTRFLQMLDIGY